MSGEERESVRFRGDKPIQAVQQFVHTPRAGYMFPALPRRAGRVGVTATNRGLGWLPALSLVGALGLYLVKVLHSPLIFTLHDEFIHWHTANDILKSGHLFRENPLLPASALFPGLEIVTAALTRLSGLTIFDAGVVVVGIARLMLVL